MSDELDRLRAVNEAQAATLRAVRQMATEVVEWRGPLPPTEFAVPSFARQLLAILDGTATP